MELIMAMYYLIGIIFGAERLSRVTKEDNSSETSGTPGYMAPEVLSSKIIETKDLDKVDLQDTIL